MPRSGSRPAWHPAGKDRLLKIPAYFSREIYVWTAEPLMRLMPPGTSMIATEVASPFFAPLKLAGVLAVALSMPWTLFQVWAFVAPGLYRTERRLVGPLLGSSTLLFYAGMAMAYFLVLPTVFKFLISVAPEGVAVMTDINKYLDFVLAIFLAFGLVAFGFLGMGPVTIAVDSYGPVADNAQSIYELSLIETRPGIEPA